jgi:hypothetical protein
MNPRPITVETVEPVKHVQSQFSGCMLILPGIENPFVNQTWQQKTWQKVNIFYKR